MRVTAIPVLALPLVLSHCGSKGDLIIGEIAPIVEAGTASVAGGGSGAEPALGGAFSAGGGGAGGTLGGGSEGGTTDMAGAAGAAGAAGDSGVGPCQAGEGPPLDSLIHRYSFDVPGDVALDSVAGADGTLENGIPALDGSGLVTLEGNPTRQHIDLPDRLISSLTDVTVVVWMTWDGGAGYQRIFDFGISNTGNAETQGSSGTSYLAMMPSTGFDNGASPGLGAEVKAAGHPTLHLASTEDMSDRTAQVALAFRSGVNAELFLDGNLISSLTTAITLADIDDRNNWLGQSQWSKDHNFNGTYEEVRIYNVALSACQLHTLLVRGPQTP